VLEDLGGFRGVEAVIDKDHATALLARELGAEVLLISTGVNGVAVDFGTPSERWLRHVRVGELRRHLADGQFGAGSMAPKVEAAIAFVEGGGQAAVVATPAELAAALRGQTGTRILP
jgi:carbamate kinase